MYQKTEDTELIYAGSVYNDAGTIGYKIQALIGKRTEELYGLEIEGPFEVADFVKKDSVIPCKRRRINFSDIDELKDIVDDMKGD